MFNLIKAIISIISFRHPENITIQRRRAIWTRWLRTLSFSELLEERDSFQRIIERSLRTKDRETVNIASQRLIDIELVIDESLELDFGTNDNVTPLGDYQF